MNTEETIFNQAYLDRYTKEVQLKIAEQIIEDIKLEYEGCQGCSCDSVDDLEQLKDQLRKKYL